MVRICLILCVLVSVSIGAASFKEGIIHFKVNSLQGDISGDLKISDKGARSKIKINQSQIAITMDMLFKFDDPGKAYQINDDAKTFTVIQLPKPQAAGERASYKVKKIGNEKLIGYKCTHYRLTQGDDVMDMWITKDIKAYKAFKNLQSANSQAADQFDAYHSLEKAGAEGFPLKTISKKGGQTMEMVVTKVEPKKLPKSVFKIPADYKEQSNAMELMQQFTGGQNGQALQNMLQENMTPEKMEQLKQMMQKALQQNQRTQKNK